MVLFVMIPLLISTNGEKHIEAFVDEYWTNTEISNPSNPTKIEDKNHYILSVFEILFTLCLLNKKKILQNTYTYNIFTSYVFKWYTLNMVLKI